MRGEGQRQALELHSCAADSQGGLAHQMVCKCVCVGGGYLQEETVIWDKGGSKEAMNVTLAVTH